jgi:hypothetical protein
MAEHPLIYEDFDGGDEAYAPIDEEPDLDSVAQRYANETGLLVVLADRRSVRLQDCECVPTTDDCEGLGAPCVVAMRECWVLTTFENTDAGRRDLADWRADGEPDQRLWEPIHG